MRMHVCVPATYCTYVVHITCVRACMHACVACMTEATYAYRASCFLWQYIPNRRSFQTSFTGVAWHRMHGTLFPSMESMPCLALPCMSASLAHVFVSMRACVHERHCIMYVDAPMPCSSQHNEKRRARLAGMAADGIYLQTANFQKNLKQELLTKGEKHTQNDKT